MSALPAPVARHRYYIDDAFIVEHGPVRTPRATAILVLPPMGYEDTSAYRPLRVLADALAAAGHVVLRLDWPALGDSARDHADPDIVARCVATATAAAASLRARGFSRVAGIGVRVGGLIALGSEGLDELVLWALPAHGKAYLREQRVFHRMAARACGEAAGAPLPKGTVEAGGFLYGPATVAALEGLVAVELLARRRPARLLLIDPDGGAPAPELLGALAGVEVSTAAVGSLGDLLDNPYAAALDPGVASAVLGWFSARDTVAARPHRAAARLSLGAIAERPWVASGGAGELSGIVSEPAGGARPGAAWTLFLNAGGIRRSGPNRLWTRAARALAAQGRPSLRFDVRDVGDSDGVSVPRGDLEEMYSEASVHDAIVAYDWLRAQGAGTIDVVGLCSGAFLGAQVAARRRVRRAVLFNCIAFVWNEDARASGVTTHIRGSLFDRRRWGRLLSGRIDARVVAGAVTAKLRLTAEAAVARIRGRAPPDEVAGFLRAVADLGTELHLVASEGDPSIAYLERHVAEAHRPRLTILPGVDHTIRPVWAHAHVVELIMGADASVGVSGAA